MKLGNIELDLEKYAGFRHREGLPWPDWLVWNGGWYEADGNNTRLCVWPLDENSVVFDVGASVGHWATRMAEHYDCYIHCFEPFPEAFLELEQRMKNNPKVKLYPFALGKQTRVCNFGDASHGTSLFTEASITFQAQIRDIAEVLPKYVDLMVVNIEGGEYELMSYLAESGLVKNFEMLMIQWHNFFPRSDEIQYGIQGAIGKTHKMMWNHGTWEAWEKR